MRIIIGDQSNASFWREFKQQYPVADIFIDDGVSESVGLVLSLYGMRDVPEYYTCACYFTTYTWA